MATVTGKSRPGSVVAEAYRLMQAAERAEKKRKPEPTPAPSKNAKRPATSAAKKERHNGCRNI